jgi:hypothetical protein
VNAYRNCFGESDVVPRVLKEFLSAGNETLRVDNGRQKIPFTGAVAIATPGRAPAVVDKNLRYQTAESIPNNDRRSFELANNLLGCLGYGCQMVRITDPTLGL